MDTQQTVTAAPLAALEGAGVTLGGARLVADIHFRLLAGQRWALLGENGAGKTTFLRLLRGEIAPDLPHGGHARPPRLYDLPGAGGPQPTPLGLRQRLPLVSGDMQDAYAVQGWRATGLDVVLAGFHDTALVYGEPDPEERRKALATLAALGLDELAGRRMADLSTGQARKILLARALACAPDVLLLDECLEGLDAPGRREFLEVLDRAAAAAPGLALLFSSHRLDELPACLDHGLILRGGRIVFSGSLSEALAAYVPAGPTQVVAAPGAAHPAAPLPQPGQPAAPPAAGFLARIRHANLEIDGARILNDVDWTILPGEHWALLGKNGAGKSSLLSLLCGATWPSALDGPPGVVEHGFARAGETLDDTRRRIGLVSAGLQANFPHDLKVDEAVCTGLDGTLDVIAAPDATGRARASEWLAFFEIAHLAGRRVRSLSRGQFRRVLLARAMLAGGDTRPDLLLLDEPMAGLDARSRRAFRTQLDRLAAGGTPLVVVTHHLRDLPDCVNRVLVLEKGRVAFRGERAAYEKRQAAVTKPAA